MPALERGETSDCTNPVLDVYFTKSSIPIDVALLEFVIFERVSSPPTLVQTYPPAGRATVDLNDCPVGHKLDTGRYVAEWDVPVDQLVGDHVITWYWKETLASNERSWSQEFNVLLPAGASSIDGYCTLQDIRDEGVTAAMFDDARVEHAIELASRYIDRVTGRWFKPRSRTFRVKARDHRVAFVEHPIISLSEVNIISGRGASLTRDAIELRDLLVFNRHLTEGLLDPDDRDTPRVEFENLRGLEYPGREDQEFPWGEQVVELIGRFGYTELPSSAVPGETSDGSQIPTSEGTTPPLIVHACKLLTMRELAPLGDPSARGDWRDRWRLEQEKTADQMYKMTSLAMLGQTGNITGDPEIDGLLASYMAPPSFGAI